MKRERIILDLPVGATWTEWTRALDCARRFATEWLDKPAGPRNGTAYAYEDGMVISAHWTSTRNVSASVERMGS